MKRKAFIALVAAILLTAGIGATAGPAKAATDTESSGPIHTFLMGRIAGLHVTDQQKAELKGIFKTNGPTLQPLVAQYVSERRALRGLMNADQPDEAAIRAQVAKVAAVGADLAVERARITQQCRGILTPEQVSAIKKMQEKRDARVDRMLARLSGSAE